MNCIDFENWLRDTSGDRQRAPTADANRHVGECASCRSRWVAETQLDALISAWQARSSPEAHTERLAARVLSAHAVSQSTASDGRTIFGPLNHRAASQRETLATTPWAVAACAAAVVLAVTLSLQSDRSPIGLAHRTRSRPDAVALVPVSDSVAALWSDVQSSSQSMAHDTLRALAAPPLQELSSLSPASAPSIPVLPGQPAPDATAEPPRGQFHEPIRKQVNAAFGFLGDVLPSQQAASAG